MNWKDITIEKLQRISAIDTDNPILELANTVSILYDLDFEKVIKMTMDELRSYDVEFLKVMPKSKLKFTFKHKGKRYRLIKTAKDMSAHHFIELQDLSQRDTLEALPEIIGCLSYRVNIFGRKVDDDYQAKVEDFKTLPITNFYNYALFFSALYPKLLNATLTFLKQETEKVKAMYSDGSVS
jgi:hypothetical protein